MDSELTSQIVSFLYNSSKQIKYFHWGYVDKDFFPYHPQLDDVYELLLDQADSLAEMGRQNDLGINPWAMEETPVTVQSNHGTAVPAVVDILQELYQAYMTLRETSTEYYVQSEIDSLAYDVREMLWKWQSSM